MSFENVSALTKMKEEYEFIGREVEVNTPELKLTVLSLPKKYKKKKSSSPKTSRPQNDDEVNYDEYKL